MTYLISIQELPTTISNKFRDMKSQKTPKHNKTQSKPKTITKRFFSMTFTKKHKQNSCKPQEPSWIVIYTANSWDKPKNDKKIQSDSHFTHRNHVSISIFPTQCYKIYKTKNFPMSYVQFNKQHSLSSLFHQIRARISPKVTCKDTLGNSNNRISTLQEILKNQILTNIWNLLQ
jgi:hypothetical protein